MSSRRNSAPARTVKRTSTRKQNVPPLQWWLGDDHGSYDTVALRKALRQIWVLEDGAPRAIHVKVGISDGRVTEVESDALQPGMQVITDQLAAGARS